MTKIVVKKALMLGVNGGDGNRTHRIFSSWAERYFRNTSLKRRSFYHE